MRSRERFRVIDCRLLTLGLAAALTTVWQGCESCNPEPAEDAGEEQDAGRQDARQHDARLPDVAWPDTPRSDSTRTDARHQDATPRPDAVLSHPCTDGTHDCDANATCIPEGATYSCSCNAGYGGDGVTCEALDTKTWYVDCAQGSDTATGHASIDPLKTLGALNSRLAQTPLAGGHGVRLKRGVTCRGALTLPFNGSDPFATPVVVGAYGDAQAGRPVITGAVPITGTWTLVTNPTMNGIAITHLAGMPIYRLPAGVQVKQLFVDGTRTSIGRWDDAWSDGEMIRGTNWVIAGNTGTFSFPRAYPLQFGTTPGHQVLIRTQEWYWAKRRIIAIDHATQTVTFDNAPVQGFTVDEWTFPLLPEIAVGVELRNALNLLGGDGQWSFDTTTQDLHLWSQLAPGQRTIEASTGGHLLDAPSLPQAATLAIADLSLIRAGGDAIHIVGRGTVTIDNVQIEDANERGIFVRGSSDAQALQSITVTGCTVERSNGNGCATGAANDIAILDNTFTGNGRLGTQEEIGNMISSVSAGNLGTILVEGNRIVESGYAGIVVWYGGQATVRGNYVHGSCVHLNDCGAFYSNGQNQPAAAQLLIENNFIRRSVPSMRGSTWTNPLAAGVYLDHAASHATIRNNAVINHRSVIGAVHVGGGSFNRVENNTVYATTWPDMDVHCLSSMPRPQGNSTSQNVFYTQSVNQANVHLYDYCVPPLWNNGDPKMLNFGGNDRFLNPLNGYVMKKIGTGVDEFAPWWPDGYMISNYVTANTSESFSNVRLEVNETFAPRSVTLDTIYCNPDGTTVQGVITLPPLSARILLRCGCNGDGVQNNIETPATCAAY